MANHRTNKIKLTRAEKQQLKALMARNQQKGKKGPHTAQDTIPYQRMWPDGICRVTDQYYTKTIQFQDINYQLAQNDDKTAIQRTIRSSLRSMSNRRRALPSSTTAS